DASNEDMNLLVMDDILPSGQRSMIDEEILALFQANSFGQLEEKNYTSPSLEEENRIRRRMVDNWVIGNMSGGLSFCGLELIYCPQREDIKYHQLKKRLFTFDGKIELCTSPMTPSYMDKFTLNNVQHFKKNVTDAIANKYGFDASIEIDCCDVESSLIREFSLDESESEKILLQKKIIVSYTYRPKGSFKIPSEIRILTKEACTRLESLKTEEKALEFLKDLGFHYPDPENDFYYGGVEMSFHSENATDKSYVTRQKESGKTSGSAKTQLRLKILANATRSRTELYLIGSSVSELRGSKLPSLRMALGFFLHLHLELNETFRHSSAAAVTELAMFWRKARIPMRDHQNCQTKLEQAFEEWRLLKKNKARKSSTQQAREAAFVSRLEDLFDIAHADALNTMSIQEDKDFLLAQREKGRREASTAELTTSGSEISAAEDVDSEGAVGGSRTQKGKRGRKAVVTPELAAALDRTKVSDRKAVFVIAETAKSLGMTIDQLALNRDSVRRLRAKHRIHSSASIRAKFQSDVPLVVHWDGKLIPDLIGKEKVDRLPVLVSGKKVLQLLTVAKLPSETGEAQASAVFGAIEDWGIPGNIRAMCFDTTSSNTGRISGTCVLLEQKLGKELLSLACRHHIMELVLGAAFRVCMGSTSSPEVPLFKGFQDYWRFIDTDKYETGIAADDVARLVDDIKQSIIDFANKHLEQSQPRDDYKEFLELVLIFLGATPARGVRFMSPGGMHHTRWMSKVIYSLKIWMFKAQFRLTLTEERGLHDVCVFAVRVYLKAWISAPLASGAPYSDLLLLKSLLDSSTKRLMVSAMQIEDEQEQEHTKRITIDLDSAKNKNLEHFVTAKSAKLFHIMDLPDGFLTVDPDLWEDRHDYKLASETVRSLKVVNDHAERGVALIQEYSGFITQDESQLQFLLQVVNEHRRVYPDSRKQTLSGQP
ncbi:hypothetical protein QYM36_014133, partial [Artemia franciscana]